MKIGIYAPALNEIDNVDSWYNSCKDADEIYVADTGSTDGTDVKLRNLGVKVTSISILPWRFDDAFNAAMNLLPSTVDVCIRLDLDERLTPGWKDALLRAWTPGTTRLRYKYVWSWKDQNVPGQYWWGDRIHSRVGYRWRGATHEGLCARIPESECYTHELEIHHFSKPKNKTNDLPLLLEAVVENPTDSRLKSYLAREYMYTGQYSLSANTYKEFLSMPSNRIERGAAMLNLAIVDHFNKEYWLLESAKILPDHRDPFFNLCQYYYDQHMWENCVKFGEIALSITIHPLTYISSEEAWGPKIHDLLSVAYWSVQEYQKSADQCRLALEFDRENPRLISNYNLITEYIKKIL